MKYLFLSGMARSGTSWLGKIFASHPDILYHYEPFNLRNVRENIPAALKFWDYLPELRTLCQEGNFEEAARRFAIPLARFENVRDHILDREPFFPQPQDPKIMAIKEDFTGLEKAIWVFGQVVTIVRNPLPMLNSLWNHTEFGRHYGMASFAQRWAENYSRVLELQETWPDFINIVRYEDLVAAPESAAKALFAWAGIDLHPEVSKFLRESVSRHEADPYSVFKDPAQVADDYKKRLSAPVVEAVKRTIQGSRAAELYPEVFG